MALPELDVARVQRWCAARVPERARHQVRVECEVAPRHLTIVERRAPWREDFGPEWSTFPIACLRYTAADKSWTLYWRDRKPRTRLEYEAKWSQLIEPALGRLAVRDHTTTALRGWYLDLDPKKPTRNGHAYGVLSKICNTAETVCWIATRAKSSVLPTPSQSERYVLRPRWSYTPVPTS